MTNTNNKTFPNLKSSQKAKVEFEKLTEEEFGIFEGDLLTSEDGSTKAMVLRMQNSSVGLTVWYDFGRETISFRVYAFEDIGKKFLKELDDGRLISYSKEEVYKDFSCIPNEELGNCEKDTVCSKYNSAIAYSKLTDKEAEITSGDTLIDKQSGELYTVLSKPTYYTFEILNRKTQEQIVVDIGELLFYYLKKLGCGQLIDFTEEKVYESCEDYKIFQSSSIE